MSRKPMNERLVETIKKWPKETRDFCRERVKHWKRQGDDVEEAMYKAYFEIKYNLIDGIPFVPIPCWRKFKKDWPGPLGNTYCARIWRMIQTMEKYQREAIRQDEKLMARRKENMKKYGKTINQKISGERSHKRGKQGDKKQDGEVCKDQGSLFREKSSKRA